MRWFIRLIFITTLLVLVIPFECTAAAAPTTPKNQGLYISPLRSYISLQAGQTVTRAFTIANLTEKPLVATVSIKQFEIANNSYDYSFTTPDNPWVHAVTNRLELKPFESREVAYTIAVPKSAPAGGAYYTLLVSADLSQAGLEGTVQAATLLYLTVEGTLVRTSELQHSHVAPIILSSEIPYTLDVRNTGNVHYFAYFSASIDGLSYHADPTGLSQLLMPGTIRHTESKVASPFLPGIYRITYGYTPDGGNRQQTSRLILFVPPWFLALIILGGITFVTLKRRKKDRVSGFETNF